MATSLEEVEREVVRLAGILDAPGDVLPTFGRSQGTGRPHVEVTKAGYHYVTAERGAETSRLTTTDLDVLLYNVFYKVTDELAWREFASHSNVDGDSRRIMFPIQVEKLAKLSARWAEQAVRTHDDIVRDHPYDDAAPARNRLDAELRKEGKPALAAWREACRRYPLPVHMSGPTTGGNAPLSSQGDTSREE